MLCVADHSSQRLLNIDVADIDRKQGRFPTAAALYEQSLATLERLFGATSARLAPVCRNLGLLAKKRGAYDEAEKWQQRALELTVQHVGAHHPDCAEVRTLCDASFVFVKTAYSLCWRWRTCSASAVDFARPWRRTSERPTLCATRTATSTST